MTKSYIAGHGKDLNKNIIPVLTGKVIFDMVDSYGFPLDILLLEMEDNKLTFDVKGFINAARNSSNYENVDRLRILLFSNLITHGNEEIIKKNINLLIEQIYNSDTSEI